MANAVNAKLCHHRRFGQLSGERACLSSHKLRDKMKHQVFAYSRGLKGTTVCGMTALLLFKLLRLNIVILPTCADNQQGFQHMTDHYSGHASDKCKESLKVAEPVHCLSLNCISIHSLIPSLSCLHVKVETWW